MSLITWKEEYSAGNREVDSQNQNLIDRVNELHAEMLLGKSEGSLSCRLDELIVETRASFAAEEKLMEEWSYPRLPAHRAEHDQFLRQLEQFRQDVEDGRMELSVRVAVFLKHWLEDHMAGSDRAYSTYSTQLRALRPRWF